MMLATPPPPPSTSPYLQYSILRSWTGPSEGLANACVTMLQCLGHFWGMTSIVCLGSLISA